MLSTPTFSSLTAVVLAAKLKIYSQKDTKQLAFEGETLPGNDARGRI